MRAYRRPFAKIALLEANKKTVESRDSVLWSIDTGGVCRVKIQGSDEMIVAHFPRNMTTRPTWLRVGNAVRISHRGGVRGYIEVIGPGRAIPSPSSGNSLPPSGATGDGIIWGMLVTATEPPTEGVMISNGAFRINQVTYYYNGEAAGFVIMQDPPLMTMGTQPMVPMGQSSFVIDMEGSEAPPVGQFRYDIIVIGIDSQTHYIVGTASSGEPVAPVVPADHILLATILRVGGDESITQNRINTEYTVPVPTDAYATYPGEVPYTTKSFSMTMHVVDQYGRAISSSWSGSGWKFTLEKIYGTGEVYSSDDGWDWTEVSQMTYGSSSCGFSYRRDEGIPVEVAPMFFVTIGTPSPLYIPIMDIDMYNIDGISLR